mgnify:CR=1 FL=1
MDSRLYWIWLQQALPYGSSAVGDLLDAFGHARLIYEATDAQLREAGVSREVSRCLADKSLDTAREILNRVLQLGDWVLTPEDALYPLSLRHMTGCPAALYARGVMPDLDSTPTVAVVGTRRASSDGWREAYSLAAGLAAGAAEGLLLVWILFVILTMFAGTEFGSEAMSMIAENPLLDFLYKNNMVSKFIARG